MASIKDYLDRFPDIPESQISSLVNELNAVDGREHILDDAIELGWNPAQLVNAIRMARLRQRQAVEEREIAADESTVPVENDVPSQNKEKFWQKWFKKKDRSAQTGGQTKSRGSKSRNWIKIGGGLVGGLLALVVLFYFLGSQPDNGPSPARTIPEIQKQETTIESVPAFTPEITVDYKSISVVGTTLKVVILGLILVPILGYLDSKERFEVSDVVFAFGGFLVNYLVVWKPIVAFMTAFEPLKDPRTALFWVTSIIFAVVAMKAATGKRDTTNLGLFFACLGFAGAIFGSLGAIQVAFNVPAQPVYLLQDLPAAILTKQNHLIQFSLLVYSMFGLSILFYMIDIFFPVDKDTRWEAVVIAVIVIAGFYLAQIWMGITVSLMISVALALVVATLARRSGRGLTTGESPLSRAVTRAFEYTAWDGVAIGVVVSVLLHLSGLA